jgi:cob(I)alamin adenosyltransferase
MATLFVPSTPTAVSDKVSGVLNSLEQTLSSLGTEITAIQAHQPNSKASEDEVQRLQDIITKLKEDAGTLSRNPTLWSKMKHVP